jgi:TetR/AcrR family transcriptional regulator
MERLENHRRRMSATERESSLIENAITAFASSNYRVVTVSRIAAEAGITEPVVYRYFHSKKELFLAALHRIETEILSGWHEAIARNEDPKQALKDISAYHSHYAENHYTRVKLLFQAISEIDDSEIRDALRGFFQSCFDLLVDLVGQCREKGRVQTGIDDALTARFLISLGIGAGFVGIFGPEQTAKEDLFSPFDFLLDSLF